MGRLPAGLRLRSLTYLDATERGEWASRFNTGAKSLGEIIAIVYQERDAHWTAPAERPSEPASWPNSPKRKAPVPAVTETPSGAGYPSARTLKDGAALCDAGTRAVAKQARSAVTASTGLRRARPRGRL